MIVFQSTWPQLDISVLVLTNHSIDSTLLGSALFTAQGCICLAYHTFLTRQ